MLCGKSSRCDMVTKGWLSVSMGVILLSASMVSILVNKSMNSLLSAFSASKSLPSRSDVMFTCRQKAKAPQHFKRPLIERSASLGFLQMTEKALLQCVPTEGPINTHKASSVRVSECGSQNSVITLHLRDITNISSGILSPT